MSVPNVNKNFVPHALLRCQQFARNAAKNHPTAIVIGVNQIYIANDDISLRFAYSEKDVEAQFDK